MIFKTAILLFGLLQVAGAGVNYYWHGACQADPNDFNLACNWKENQDGTGAYPPGGNNDDFTADVLNGWTFINTNTTPDWGEYSLTDNPDRLTLRSRGEDVWDEYNEFAAIVRNDIDGDFDVSVHVISQTNTYHWAKAGIMAANDISNLSAGGYIILAITPELDVALQYASSADGKLNQNATSGSITAPVYLRLVKSGTQFTGYYKKNLTDAWTQVGSTVSPGGTGADSEIGLFMSAHTNSEQGTVVMDDFQGGGSFSMASLSLFFNGTGEGRGADCKMTADATVDNIDWSGYTGAFDFNNNALSISGDAISAAGYVVNGESGGSMNFIAPSGEQLFIPRPGQEMTHIIHSGGGTLNLSTNVLAAKSFTQTAGILDFNGVDVNIQSGGDFRIANGGAASIEDLGGVTITVDGDAVLNGQSGSLLNLNPDAPWTIDVQGTLRAGYATLKNSRASGSPGLAGSSVDQGGNEYWTFVPAGEWLYSRNWTLNTGPSGANITNDVEDFPVLIRLTADNFSFNEAQPDGEDIRFQDSQGNDLAYEIESWNVSAQAAEIWVLVPLVRANTQDQTITMKWGNSSVQSQSNGADVFKAANSFGGVWHMAQEPIVTNFIPDATGNNHGDPVGSMTSADLVTGIIGPGIDFDGNDDAIDIDGGGLSTSEGTITLWTKVNSFPSSGSHYFFGHSSSASSPVNRVQLYTNDVGGNLDLGLGDNHNLATGLYDMQADVWYQLTLTWDGANYEVFVDNNSVASGTYSGLSTIANADIGNDGILDDRDEALDGVVDEVQVSNIARPADWIKLSYENQKENQTLVKEGASYLMGVSSMDRFIPFDIENGYRDWAEDQTADGNTISTGGVAYENGIGGQPMNDGGYSWLLYDIESEISRLNVSGNTGRLTGFAGKQDGSESVNAYIKTSISNTQPAENDWIYNTGSVVPRFSAINTSNQPVDIDLTDVKWLWLGLNSNSSSTYDHGVFGDLSIILPQNPSTGTYYWNGVCADGPTNFNLPCNWWSNPDGTGANPPSGDFSSLNLLFSGTGAGSNNPCTITGDVTVVTVDMTGYTGEFSYDGRTITVLGDYINTGGSISGQSGATVVFAASGGVQAFTPQPGEEMPAIVHSGAGTLQLQTNPLLAQGFTQTAGALDFGGNNVTIQNGGDFEITNGTSSAIANLGGVTITVTGDAVLNGQPGSLLNLNPDDSWTISVTGTLTAGYASLKNSTASGSPGTAGNSIDQGGNEYWNFGPPPEPGEWLYSQDLILNTSPTGADITGDVSNFPLLVRLNDENFLFSQARASGEDIRFTDSQGNNLAYEIERWDNAGEAAEIWVLVPEVEANNPDQTITMKWGNPTVQSQSNGAAVFATVNSHTAVYHMPGLADATENNLDGINNNSTEGQGMIGNGRNFDGDDWIEIADPNGTLGFTSHVTLSAWIKPSDTDGGYSNVFARQYGTGSGDSWQIGLRDDEFMGPLYDHRSGTASQNIWYHLVAVKNSGNEQLYVNGVAISTRSDAPLFNTDPNEVTIGCQYQNTTSPGECFAGVIDEVRASGINRSVDWIKLSFENQKENQTLVEMDFTPPLWQYSGKFDIKTSAAYANIQNNIYNFPLLIRLDNNNFDFTQAKSNGSDLRFKSSSGQALSYHIESFDAANRKAAIWVLVPEIKGNNDFQHINMYWGNNGAESESNSEAVFNSNFNFQGVYHMSDYNDASNNGRNATTPNGALTDVPGVIGRGKGLSGGAYAEIAGLMGQPASLTLSGWVDLTAIGLTAAELISLGDNASIRLDQPSYGCRGLMHTATDWEKITADQFVAGTGWRHIAYTVNSEGNAQKLFIDGVEAASGSETEPIAFSVGPNTVIGAHGASSANFNLTGNVDEIRISSTARSADWVKLSYETQKTGQVVVTPDKVRQKLEFNLNTSTSGINISNPVHNFPILVQLNSGNFNLDEAGPNGETIDFIGPDGVSLPFEIAEWDVVNERASIWVLATEIKADDPDQSFALTWGPGQGGVSSGPGVFSNVNGFAGVYHLDEDGNTSAGGYKDASPNNAHGQGVNMNAASDVAGISGRAQDFEKDAGQYITLPQESLFDFTDAMTVSCWIKVESFYADYQTIVAKGDDTWRVSRSTGNTLHFGANGTGDNLNGSVDVNDGEWHHVAIVLDGSAKYLYVDGELDVSGAATGVIDQSGDAVWIGNNSDYPDRLWDGLIDEVQISNVARSADWIKLSYASQKPNKKWPTYGNINKMLEQLTIEYQGNFKSVPVAKGLYNDGFIEVRGRLELIKRPPQ